MKRKYFYLFIFVVIAGTSVSRLVSAESKIKRVRFSVRVIAEKNGDRKELARTTIEGLPGTDFEIDLKTGKFEMHTKFLTDLVSPKELRVRVSLETRRFYGRSPSDLPLYEEDKQKHDLKVGLDETIFLLPFGKNPESETLKIEIEPLVRFLPAKGKASRQLTIDFDKRIPSGEIFIKAAKIPHNFDVEAVLYRKGREYARGMGECLFKEECEISLKQEGDPQNDNKIITAKVNVNRYMRGHPKYLAGIDYGFYSTGISAVETQPLKISGGQGVVFVGGELVYPVIGEGFSQQDKYELRFRIRLDKEEKD